jgi:hypothetical protein
MTCGEGIHLEEEEMRDVQIQTLRYLISFPGQIRGQGGPEDSRTDQRTRSRRRQGHIRGQGDRRTEGQIRDWGGYDDRGTYRPVDRGTGGQRDRSEEGDS